MYHDINEYKQRHLTFWDLSKVNRPLVGFTIGAGLDVWSYWQYNKATRALLNRENIPVEEINPEDFIKDQRKYLQFTEQIEDDLCRSAMPLASVPWMEAILGCSVYSSEANMKSREILDDPTALQPVDFNPHNPWIEKYLQFIKIYTKAFSRQYPVSQSVLRGPSDLACALLGAEKATMALALEPQAMHHLLEYITSQLEEFLRLQLKHLPQFHGGYVIGQYEIWAPKPAIRIQEDFSVLYSPQLYSEFLRPMDEQLAGISEYTLIHLHASSLFLIDQFLKVSTIRAFQITKDPGGAALSDMIPGLIKIQNAGKPLIVKGQFDEADLNLMKHKLSLRGLCIQPVVSSLDDAEQMLPYLRNWN
jgi:uroporphyrinogen-III decarboxylase